MSCCKTILRDRVVSQSPGQGQPQTNENEKMIKPGDIVELLPTNQRNRQLRKQENKHDWTVLKIDPNTICFNRQEGILIQSIRESDHTRWVQRDDIELKEFRENGERDER